MKSESTVADATKPDTATVLNFPLNPNSHNLWPIFSPTEPFSDDSSKIKLFIVDSIGNLRPISKSVNVNAAVVAQ